MDNILKLNEILSRVHLIDESNYNSIKGEINLIMRSIEKDEKYKTNQDIRYCISNIYDVLGKEFNEISRYKSKSKKDEAIYEARIQIKLALESLFRIFN